MNEAAVATLVSGLVTVVTLVVGFLTLWVKLRYGAIKAEEAATRAVAVERKIDSNTQITTEVKVAAERASEHAMTCDEDKLRLLKALADHDARIGTLETQMTALKLSLDGLSKGIDSTRHEMRGHLQALGSKLDLIGMTGRTVGTAPPGRTP